MGKKKISSPHKQGAGQKEIEIKIGSGIVSVDIKTHKDKKGGHPHVIIDNIDDKHVSVGLSTHPKKGKNGTNYALEKNPLDGNKQSYLRRQGTVDKKENYYSKRKGSMTRKDYERAKVYGDRAKQKYISQKNKKSNDSAKRSK